MGFGGGVFGVGWRVIHIHVCYRGVKVSVSVYTISWDGLYPTMYRTPFEGCDGWGFNWNALNRH